MKRIGIYMLNGFSPSPWVEMQFDSQVENPINGNDIYNKAFGTCATRRHKEFKAFFALQDPLNLVGTRKTQPNWKLQQLFKACDTH